MPGLRLDRRTERRKLFTWDKGVYTRFDNRLKFLLIFTLQVYQAPPSITCDADDDSPE